MACNFARDFAKFIFHSERGIAAAGKQNFGPATVSISNHHAFDLIEAHLIAPPVIELRP